MIQTPSPNFEPRKPGFETPSILVLHYTDCKTPQEALDILCDPHSKVNAHYMIEEDGTCHQLVDESMRAWHAGMSFWRGCTDVNSASIGIELCNPGHRYGPAPFPAAQMENLTKLAKQIVEHYSIASIYIVAHSDVAPTRRKDPGELFDWRYLADQGLGLMPQKPASLFRGTQITDVLETLASIGYNPGEIRESPQQVIEAFCRHYLPEHFTIPASLDEIGALAREVMTSATHLADKDYLVKKSQNHGE